MRYYVSEYVRAKETAALLDLPNALWRTDVTLRERNWGDLDVMTEEERMKLFSKSLERKKLDGFLWQPPNGESMADVCIRAVYRLFDTLHRQCSDGNVIVVSHSETIWANRYILEGMNLSQYFKLDASKDPHDRIHNCQVIQYTRQNPFDVSAPLLDRLGWFRSVCPWDLSLSSNQWQEIKKPLYTNEELMQQVEEVPRLLNE